MSLSMMEGFAPTGTVGMTWKMSVRALKRLRTGEKPRWRRFQELPALKYGSDVMDSYDGELPTAAVCYACGLVNLIGTQTIGRPAMLSLLPSPVNEYPRTRRET